MAPTPAQTALGYHKMWDAAGIDAKHIGEANLIARRILAARDNYTGLPAPIEFVGPVHMRESSLSFTRHLHNGDPLTARTRQVPAGRPVKGNPPFTWKQSALDALGMPPHSLGKVDNWSVERILYEQEKYNGWGYLGKGNSPYLWSWTSLYVGGKYIRDHVYSATAKDPQPGTVAIMKAMARLDPDIAAHLSGNRQATPPKDVIEERPAEIKKATKKERVARTAGAAGGAGSGASTQTVPDKTGTVVPIPSAPTVTHYMLYAGVALGIVVVIVATVLIARKKSALMARW